jgi:uncharacterized protein
MIILFILVFLTIFSLIIFFHVYLYKRIKIGLNLSKKKSLILKIILSSLCFSPFFTEFISHSNLYYIPIISGYIGYLWLGYLLILTYLLLIEKSIFYFLKWIKIKYNRMFTFLPVMGIALLLLIYGFHEANSIKIKKIIIKTNKIKNRKKIRIVLISDVHFNQINQVSFARKIVDKINRLKPDIIVCAGDILDKGIRNRRKIIHIFKKLKAPMGKFAVTGNHEYIAGIDFSIRFLVDSGFYLIRNKYIDLENGIVLAGVDDIQGVKFGQIKMPDEIKLLKSIPKDKYIIFLKHQPKINKETIGLFDLQLSGHTHNGQIFPTTYLVKILFPYISGYYSLSKKSKLYISNGVGTWGPPIRILAPPEISVIELVSD